MALRSRVLSPLLAGLVALGVYATASSAQTATPTAPIGPVVTTVTPLQLQIGQRLRITGRGFVPGRRRNTVVFKRDGRRAIFVKADRATRNELIVVVPDKLAPLLAEGGRPTTFRLRVLARRFGKRFTPLGRSPRILPAPPAATAPPAPAPAGPSAPPPDCDADGIADVSDLDDDEDGLADTEEAGFGTDRCKKDTDADGLRDLWEIESALDLNLRAYFYPGKAPYPNPLFPGDAGQDFDQDGMTADEEHDLWSRSGGGRPLAYSDGDQDTTTGSQTFTAATAESEHLDVDGSGRLTDDEKDFDRDRLTNWDESHGRLRGDWWKAAHQENPYFEHPEASSLLDAVAVNGRPGATRMYADPDVDGDGVLDGADDQDHDGFTNEDELRRVWTLDLLGEDGVVDHGLRVNPFNPCLPDANSRTCSLHPPFEEPWAPFDDSSGVPYVVEGTGVDGRDQHLMLTPGWGQVTEDQG